MSVIGVWVISAFNRQGKAVLLPDWSLGSSFDFNFPKFKSRWSPRRPYNHAERLL
jgi:hypothetical protein